VKIYAELMVKIIKHFSCPRFGCSCRQVSLDFDSKMLGVCLFRTTILEVNTGLFARCAEGLYTEILAERCELLLVLDLSPTALARTQSRCGWSERVRFNAFDLRNEAIPGTFDLIVVAGVLEYFSRPYTFFRVRKKLTAALRPNGYLLVETTRANPVVENAWWGRRLIRGRWINVFVSEHSSLAIISAATTDSCSITLYRRVESSRVQ
jgi:SAM-dependent methyltransferase